MKNSTLCFLIEDDLDDQEIFQLCLSDVRRDVKCVTANNGMEALQKLKADEQFTPDIIFLDVNMPKMNGLDCLQHLKEIDRLSKACIYMYSTTSEKNAIEKSKRLGADEYIIKPARPLELRKRLAKAFNDCRQTRNIAPN